jgi:hypothetical protein
MSAHADQTPFTNDTELAVLPPLAPVPAQAAPSDSPRPGSPAADAAATARDEPLDLAGETVRRRSERHRRKLSIQVRSQLTLRVRHPDGGDCTVEEIVAQEAAQRHEIEQQAAGGSRRHRRLKPWIRTIPKFVLGFDLGMLLYFFSGITNVDWTSPLSLALAFAVALAAMVTLLSYGFLAFTGDRLRSHKNDAGTIYREDVDGITAASFVIALVVIAVLAVLMFTRIRTEVLYALGAQATATALVIAAAVGVVNAAANILVVAVHALDGSDQTARLDKLSAAVRKPLSRAHRLRERAARHANG